jgi:hypothetical protein
MGETSAGGPSELTPGQEVQMEVLHGLSTVVSDVGHQPPAIRKVAAELSSYFGHIYPRGIRCLIVGIEVIQRGNVILGNDENVGGSNGSNVAEGDRILRLHHLVRRDFPRD